MESSHPGRDTQLSKCFPRDLLWENAGSADSADRIPSFHKSTSNPGYGSVVAIMADGRRCVRRHDADETWASLPTPSGFLGPLPVVLWRRMGEENNSPAPASAVPPGAASAGWTLLVGISGYGWLDRRAATPATTDKLVVAVTAIA